MTQSRQSQVSVAATPYYHCINRCVRRAFLCGQDPYTQQSYEHRRAWVESRLKALDSIFAIDLCAYAVMSNHLHLVLRLREDVAATWSEEEVTRRWTTLFLGARSQLMGLAPPLKSALIERWRGRLSSMSWFMRCISESIARRANKEDGVSGRFWEGRFKSQALLDEGALLACMAYVDLNPVRAGMAKSIEGSRFTSAQHRVKKLRKAQENNDTKRSPKKERVTPAHLASMPVTDRSVPTYDDLPISLESYLSLLRWTAKRSSRSAGSTEPPTDVAATLIARELSPEKFVDFATQFEKMSSRFIGSDAKTESVREALGCRHLGGQRRLRQFYAAA